MRYKSTFWASSGVYLVAFATADLGSPEPQVPVWLAFVLLAFGVLALSYVFDPTD